MSKDPETLDPSDFRPVAERESEFDRDASPEEADELRAQRFARVIHIGGRYADAIERGELSEDQETTRRSLESIAYRRRMDLATERGVPSERGVLPVAAADDLATTPAVVAVQRAMAWRDARGARQPLVLVVLGPVGTGKSVALGHAIAHHERNARHVIAPDVLPRASYSELRAARAKMVAVDLLAIDEIGTEEKPTVVLDMILDRYNAGKATIIAGNVTKEQFSDRYADDRLRSRLGRQQADGQNVLVVLTGSDLRARKP